MSDGLVRMPCRLAIREEGKWVNAYFAIDNTMEGARFLGSLDIGLAGDEKIFSAWKALMHDALSLIIEKIVGVKPVFGGEEKAPEHERAGNA